MLADSKGSDVLTCQRGLHGSGLGIRTPFLVVKLAVKIVISIVSLMALGFCVAYVIDDLWHDAFELEEGETAMDRKEVPVVSATTTEGWKAELGGIVAEEGNFADQLLAEGELEGGLMLSLALADLSEGELEEHFMELMARDLDDYRAVDYAGRILQEIARRQPERAVGLLGAMSPAEKESLVPSVARGWTLRDPEAAFSWIADAWVQEDGAYIDRNLQNALYVGAMEAVVGEMKEYGVAANVLAGLVDPELKAALTKQVAHRMVADGPERALERLAEMESSVFDASVMDAVAEQWAARDGVGAADWVVANEAEMSVSGVRSIAKHLTLGFKEDALVGFHGGLLETEKRDSVASEVARLKARREPEQSARWVQAIERPERRQSAVFDALYEIGYDDFSRSVGFIDSVYELGDEGRSPVIYLTLKDWLAVDLEAVAGYLGSGRANLSSSLSEELLLEMEQMPQG